MPASSRPPRPHRSGVFAPKRANFRQRVAGRAVWLFITLLGMTIRFRTQDGAGFFARTEAPPQMIFAIWHNRLSLALVIYRRYVARPWPGRRMAAMVSASRDGGFLAHILKLFDVIPVRGSSSRRGAQALLELTRVAEQGVDLAVTPDGPRGPCYRVQDGVIAAAQVTGLPIVPISFDLAWKLRLRSWDRFFIPLPFSPCILRSGEPVWVPRDADDVVRRAAREQLESRLCALAQD